MRCCGVLNAEDWRQNVSQPDWDPPSLVKPRGCCKYKKDNQELEIFLTHHHDTIAKDPIQKRNIGKVVVG